MRRFFLHAAVVGGLLLVLRPVTAEACSAPLPHAEVSLPDGARIPANAPAIPLAFWGDPTIDGIVFSGPGGEVPFVREEGLLVLSETLAPGEHTVTITSSYEGGFSDSRTASFTATGAAPLPAALGTVAALAPKHFDIEVEDWSGACSLFHDAVSVDLEVMLAAEAEPWADLLRWSTEVDGSPWSHRRSILAYDTLGGSWHGRGRDRVFALCDEEAPTGYGVAEGSHSASLQATLAGTELALTTNTVDFSLECGSGGGDGGDGCAVGGGGSTAFPLLALALLALRRRRPEAVDC